MQSLPSGISQSFWGESIKEWRSAAEFRSESHHCRLARSGKVSCMRDALMRVWSLGRFQLERGEWPRDMGLSQKRYLDWIMKGALEGMDRSGTWLKLRLHGEAQWEKRLENRGWGSYKSTERAGRHVTMTQNTTESRRMCFIDTAVAQLLGIGDWIYICVYIYICIYTIYMYI